MIAPKPHPAVLPRRRAVAGAVPRALAAAALGAATVLVAPSPRAQSASFPALGGGDAMSLQAERLEIDIAAGEAVLTGSVVLTKGDLKVTCPRLELKFDTGPHVTWAKGSGGVSADVKGVHAEGPEVDLDLGKHLLELRGGVRLSRGQGWLQADRASIDTVTAKVTLTQVRGSIPVPPKGP